MAIGCIRAVSLWKTARKQPYTLTEKQITVNYANQDISVDQPFGRTIALALKEFPKFWRRGMGVHSIAWWPTLVVVAVATFTDLRSRRIPNWLVLPFLLAGIVIAPWRHDWPGVRQGFLHGLGQSLAGLGLGLLIYGVLFWIGGMGAGDVKLCAAIGAWIGPGQLFWATFFTTMAGGIIVLCWAVFRGYLKDLFTGKSDPGRVHPLKRKMPYAPAIAIGTLISFFSR
jgi:prepilin peptidase CpaA